MKLIGITGMAGSGKTTFSDILGEKENVGVIHVDDLLKVAKLKYFKMFMKPNKDNERTKVDSRLKEKIYSNKILFNLFMRFRAKVVEKPLNNKIEEYRKQKKDIVIIDDIFLKYHKCYKDLNRIISMQRPYKERRNAVIERDGISKKEVVSYDVAHTKNNYRDDIYKVKVVKIDNKSDMQDLRKKAEKFYRSILLERVSIREREDIIVKEGRKRSHEKCNGQSDRKNKGNKQPNSDGSRS